MASDYQQQQSLQGYTSLEQTNAYIVYGIPIRDEPTARLTRKVISLSLAIVLFSVSAWVISIVAWNEDSLKAKHEHDSDDEDNDSVSVSVPIVTAICIPCFGYYGAKEHKIKWLNCFWICNLLCVINFVASVIANLVVLSSGKLNDTGRARKFEKKFQLSSVNSATH
eukprot:gb/GECG01004845.1/.p1 GENE.gb/GECG01004845.1/~~gb/GECG01004845.1/.p1  ORF type:complete len:167 (+),score=14.31 gb/GECG01004845.1/:1-501(+)